jgi:hypothetical protein
MRAPINGNPPEDTLVMGRREGRHGEGGHAVSREDGGRGVRDMYLGSLASAGSPMSRLLGGRTAGKGCVNNDSKFMVIFLKLCEVPYANASSHTRICDTECVCVCVCSFIVCLLGGGEIFVS